jgi:hypothetical protein
MTAASFGVGNFVPPFVGAILFSHLGASFLSDHFNLLSTTPVLILLSLLFDNDDEFSNRLAVL